MKAALNKSKNAKNAIPELFRLFNIEKEAINAHAIIKDALMEAFKMWENYEEFYNAMDEILEEMENGIVKPTSLKEHHARIEKMRKLHKSRADLFENL